MILGAAVGLVLYHVTTVSPSRGRVVDVKPAACRSSATIGLAAPPPTLALAAGGAFGFVEHDATASCGEDAVTVVRRDGTRLTLARPPDDVVTPSLRWYCGSQQCTGSSVAAVQLPELRLADDGTPFVTVGHPYDGARIGLSEAVFSWNGEQWVHRPVALRAPDVLTNVAIGAVESAERFAVYADDRDAASPPDPSLMKSPTYREPVSALDVAGSATPLGLGIVVAMRGPYGAGYAARERGAERTTAVVWRAGARHELGDGVAFGVDANGDAVGDDRTRAAAEGHPILWRDGRAIQLSRKIGSAYAVRDGTIVGSVDGRAFIARADEPGRLRLLDTMVPAGWRIRAAYAIARDGRIFAVGRRSGTDDEMLLLDPLQSGD